MKGTVWSARKVRLVNCIAQKNSVMYNIIGDKWEKQFTEFGPPWQAPNYIIGK